MNLSNLLRLGTVFNSHSTYPRCARQVAEEASAVETQEDIAKKLNLDEGEEKRINTTYMKWLSVYRKQYDESRFWTFASNFLEMEIYCRENGQTMHFNRWLDCTEEECIAINSGQPIANVEATEAARFDAEAKARLGQIAGKFSKSNNFYFQDSFKQFYHLLIIAL